jgi:DNA-binding Lrp family transcriptional regulator
MRHQPGAAKPAYMINRLRIGPDAMRNLLSEQDARILSSILSSNDGMSSQQLSREAGISVSAVRARRRTLARKYLTVTHSLNLQRYGWRQLQLLISTSGGRTVAIGKELMKLKQVVFVAGTIGEVKIDLRAEVYVRSGQELLDLLENVKALNGVREVVWSEVAEVIGIKNPPPQLHTREATPDSLQR